MTRELDAWPGRKLPWSRWTPPEGAARWLPRGGDHVDDGDAARADLLDGAREDRGQGVGLLDRPLGPAAEAAGQRGQVGRRIGHAHAGPGAPRRAAARGGDSLLVLRAVVVGAVAAHDDEQWQAVVE